jgi:membrane dipeptidase
MLSNSSFIPLFDGHCDALSLVGAFTPRRTPFEPYAQIYAVWGNAAHNWSNRFEPLYDKFTLADKSGVDACLSVEGAHLLDCSLERLREAALLGVRILTLTWNNPNALSGSCAEDSERGLSHLGRKFITECEKLSIFPDVSHLSERGFFDLCGIALKPIVATHSNSAAIHNHRRNLTDEQFKLIVQSGGIVGLNLHSDFIGGNTIDALLRHFLHFLEFDGAERTLAIGTDFDGGIDPPTGLEDYSQLPNLYSAMLDAGIPEPTVRNIFYNNWNRLINHI